MGERGVRRNDEHYLSTAANNVNSSGYELRNRLTILVNTSLRVSLQIRKPSEEIGNQPEGHNQQGSGRANKKVTSQTLDPILNSKTSSDRSSVVGEPCKISSIQKWSPTLRMALANASKSDFDKLLSLLRAGRKVLFSNSEQLLEVHGEAEFKTNFINNLVLAHSNVILKTWSTFTDSSFLKDIYNQMLDMRLTKIYRIQGYGWPHLLRGNSLFIVNPPKSGKTWTYIPPVCNLVYYCSKISRVPDTYGPISIVLVPSASQVEQVEYRCNRLLTNKNIRVVPSFGMHTALEVKLQLLNGCGILVTTPASFLRLIRDNERELLIDSKRLQQLIIDGMDLMLARSESDFKSVLKFILQLCRKSPTGKVPLQLVVVSQEWMPSMAQMIRSANQPLLVFGDFLEAAVYGKNEITIKLCPKNDKLDTIFAFIEKHESKNEHLIIFCNSDADVREVSATLRSAGHACISFHGESKADGRDVVKQWKKKLLDTQILVCTDLGFAELDIQTAHNNIHYTMADSWTRFTTRFKCQAQLYSNLVANDFQATPQVAAHSLILLDEDNSMQLPRLISFMEKHNQVKHIHRDILAVSKRVSIQIEEQRALQRIPFCALKLEFGECCARNCGSRHTLTRYDVVGRNKGLPQSGDVHVLILKVFSPTHCAARLLEHKANTAGPWREICRSSEAVLFLMRMEMHYSMPGNCILYWPPKVDDLCIYKKQNKCHRARILTVPEIHSWSTVQLVKVQLKLIDDGMIVSDVESANLFVCHAQFEDFPAQAVEIRLLGVMPFDNEQYWDSDATKFVETGLVNIKENDSVFVSVNFVFASTLWVNNVIVMEKLPTIEQFVYRFNLKQSLIRNNFALIQTDPKRNIRNIAVEIGLIDDEEESDAVSSNEYHSANSSITDDTTSDDEATKHEVKIKSRGVECKVNANNPVHDASTWEEWCTMTLGITTKVRMRRNNIDEQGNIYAQLFEDAHVQQFAALTDVIDEYVTTLKDNMKATFKYAWLKPLRSCIVKFDSYYRRAKVHSLDFNDNGERVYNFLLCDLACFVTSTRDQLSNDDDFVYETSKNIIEFTPYQAVICRPTGIKLENFTKNYEIPESTFVAFAISANVSDEIIYARSFGVLLYEGDSDKDLSSDRLLNETLVKQGLATFDPATKHLLNLHNNAGCVADTTKSEDSGNVGVFGFEELLISIHKSFALEAQVQEKDNAAQFQEKDNAACPAETSNGSAQFNDGGESDSTLNTTALGLPTLMALNRHPQISWYQTAYIICLIIHAPDVKQFYLEVTKDELYFASDVPDGSNGVVLKLLGTVKPELVFYETRGLNINVRLVKNVFEDWPRLLEQSTKPPWLKYHFRDADIENTDQPCTCQLQTSPENKRVEFEDDTSEDDESTSYKNFPPIKNHDIFDPVE